MLRKGSEIFIRNFILEGIESSRDKSALFLSPTFFASSEDPERNDIKGDVYPKMC